MLYRRAPNLLKWLSHNCRRLIAGKVRSVIAKERVPCEKAHHIKGHRQEEGQVMTRTSAPARSSDTNKIRMNVSLKM